MTVTPTNPAEKGPGSRWERNGIPSGWAAPSVDGMSTHSIVFRIALAVAALVCASTATAAATPPLRPASPTAASAPSAAGFAVVFLSTAGAYARAHGDPARIADPDCVEAARGRYMCSYRTLRPGHSAQCHLVQARWTPQLASAYTVTLAGRVKRCGTLREALRSLG